MTRTLLPLYEAEFVRYKLLGERALRQVRPEELNIRGDDGNSVAIIVWHVAGNLESKFTDLLTTDGEKPWRNRDSEFEPRVMCLPRRSPGSGNAGGGVLLGALAELTDDDLAAPITIRGVPFRVDEALLRSLAHLAYHVGQIVLLARSFRGRGLGVPEHSAGAVRGVQREPGAGEVVDVRGKRGENAQRLTRPPADGARASGGPVRFRQLTLSGTAAPACRPGSPRRTPSPPRRRARRCSRGKTRRKWQSRLSRRPGSRARNS